LKLPRPWPWACLLGLGLFVTAEALVWRYQPWLRFLARHAPPGLGDPALSAAQLRLLPRSEEPAVLLLGSSQIREGLDCAVLEARLPERRCHNLAVGGGSPLDVLQIARRSAGRLPRRVVVTGLFPKVLHAEPKPAFLGRDAFACLLFTETSRRMEAREWLDAAYGLLAGTSETLRTRDALWATWASVRGDLPRAWHGQRPPGPRRMLEGEPPKPQRYFDERLGLLNFDTRPGTFTPAQEAALFRLAGRERARGNRVVVIDFPTRPGYETTIPQEALVHYAGLLDRLRREKDIVFVEAAALPPLGTEDFLDFTHLSEPGRRKVSERVADLLGEHGMANGPQ
jgi:hypothetical protein